MAQVAGIFERCKTRMSLRAFMRVVEQPYWRLRDYLRATPRRLRTRRKRVPNVDMYRLRTESVKPCSPVLSAGIRTTPTLMLPVLFSRSD